MENTVKSVFIHYLQDVTTALYAIKTKQIILPIENKRDAALKTLRLYIENVQIFLLF